MTLQEKLIAADKIIAEVKNLRRIQKAYALAIHENDVPRKDDLFIKKLAQESKLDSLLTTY